MTRRVARGRALSFLLTAVLAASAPAQAATAATAAPAQAKTQAQLQAKTQAKTQTLRVGSQDLNRCAASPAAYCGTLKVPLDWQRRGGPDISVCYRWYPATGTGRPAGTVLPVEGGPGYPSILSVAPDGYAAMYGPVLRRFNMLAIDLRGTGCSTVLDCPALQNYAGPSGSLALAAVVGRCADALNTRWRAPGGGYVHASDLFTSAESAADVAAMRDLITGKQIDTLLYNEQATSPVTAQLQSLARSAGIPVVAVTETMPPNATFESWQLGQVNALRAALAR